MGALVGMFLKTQKGVDAVTSTLEPLKVLFQTLIGVMQNAGEKLFEMFNNPKQTIIDIGNLIKQNIINRLEGLAEIWDIISSGSLDGLGEALTKTATGVEDLGGKLKGFADGVKETADEALARGKRINDLNIEAEKQAIALVDLETKNLAIIKEAELITKDKTKTDAERQTALDNALKASLELESVEQNILDLKIEKMELEFESNATTRDEELELANLRKDKANATIKQQGVEMKFIGVKAQLSASSANQAKKIATDKLNSTIQNLDVELEMFKETNREKLASDGELNSAFVQTKIETLKFINDKELEALQLKFDNGLLKENEFNLAKLQTENEFQETKKELLSTLADEVEAERIAKVQAERDQKQMDFEVELEENSLRRQTEHERKIEDESIQFEMDAELLSQRLADGQITEDNYNTLNALSTKKHNDKLN